MRELTAGQAHSGSGGAWAWGSWIGSVEMLRTTDAVGGRGLAGLWTSEHLSVQPCEGQAQEQTRPALGFTGCVCVCVEMTKWVNCLGKRRGKLAEA